MSPSSGPDRIAFRIPCVSAEELEHPLAPLVERVVWLEQPQRRHRARPLKGAEHDVVREAGSLAAHERVLHQRRPQRLESAAEVGEPFLLLRGELLEAGAEPLLARLAKVSPVFFMQMI